MSDLKTQTNTHTHKCNETKEIVGERGEDVRKGNETTGEMVV